MCRFLDAGNNETIRLLSEPASKKGAKGTKSRVVCRGGAAGAMGILPWVHAGLEACGNGQPATRLVGTHHLRNLLRLADVVDLGREVQPPQCHAQLEAHTGHDTVAVADARSRLGKMQL